MSLHVMKPCVALYVPSSHWQPELSGVGIWPLGHELQTACLSLAVPTHGEQTPNDEKLLPTHWEQPVPSASGPSPAGHIVHSMPSLLYVVSEHGKHVKDALWNLQPYPGAHGYS